MPILDSVEICDLLGMESRNTSRCWYVFGLVLVLGVGGCGKKEAAAPPVQTAKPTSSTMPSLATPAEAPPPAVVAPAPLVPPPPPPPGGAKAVAASAALANGLVRTVDEQGQLLSAEKIIYKAIEIYVEGLGKPYPKDLNELVQAKVLQAMPPAPAGQKWALDNKQSKVVLVAQ